jgi:soluble lytic murein transglycosylase-like protein
MKKYIMCAVLTMCMLVILFTAKKVDAFVEEETPIQVVEEIPIEPVEVVELIREPVEVVKEPTAEEIIIQVAEEYSIAPALMLALAEVESGFDPNAISKTGDHGLMQINKRNHVWLSEELGITDWYDVRQNTEAACYILNWLRSNFDECEDVACCLMAYNMGITRAREAWEQGIYYTEFCEKVLDLEYEIGRELDGM